MVVGDDVVAELDDALRVPVGERLHEDVVDDAENAGVWPMPMVSAVSAQK
jgi:hypothetical protein